MPEQLELPLSPFDSEVETEPEVSEEVAAEELEEDISPEGDSELEEDIDEILDDDEELDDEEFDDEEFDDEEYDDDDSDDEEVDTVPHAALHKERERRKELQGAMAEQQRLLTEANEYVSGYQKALEGIEEQLEELGLEDAIKIDAPAELSDEVKEARAAKEAAAQKEQVTNLVTEMRVEAAQHLEEFPQIDGNDPEQAELVIGFAMASTMLGGEMEDSVVKAMSILNKHLATAKKSVRRRAAPQKRAAPKRRTAGTTATAIRKGNVGDVFKGYAGDMLQE